MKWDLSDQWRNLRLYLSSALLFTSILTKIPKAIYVILHLFHLFIFYFYTVPRFISSFHFSPFQFPSHYLSSSFRLRIRLQSTERRSDMAKSKRQCDERKANSAKSRCVSYSYETAWWLTCETFCVSAYWLSYCLLIYLPIYLFYFIFDVHILIRLQCSCRPQRSLCLFILQWKSWYVEFIDITRT